MGTITALTEQKGDRTRINVFVDGQFACGLAAVVALELRIGQQITDADLEALQARDDYERARAVALTLLARRPYSTAEVARHLRRKGYDQTVVTGVIAVLEQAELLDDAAFAAYWVEQRDAFRPRSRMALRQELQLRGVPREVVDQAAATLDEAAAAARLAQRQARRWSQLPEDEFRRKLTGYLLRQGFPYEVAGETAIEMWRALTDQIQDQQHGSLHDE